MERINVENATVTSNPYVTIDGVNYDVNPGEYEGGTDLDHDLFEELQDNIEEELIEVKENINEMRYDLITDGPPVKTGRKVDGKNEYVLMKALGSLPNNSTKTVATTIDLNDIELIINLYGTAVRLATSDWFVMGGARIIPTGAIGIQGTNVSGKFGFFVETGTNRTDLNGYGFVFFTYKNEP